MSARYYLLVYYNCEIIQDSQDGVKFCGQNSVLVDVQSSMNLSEIHNKILRKLRKENKRITQMMYRLPLLISQGAVRYGSCSIDTDDDLMMMFDCHSQFRDLHVMEVFVAIEELQFSSEGSNPLQAIDGMSLAQPPRIISTPNPTENENCGQVNLEEGTSGAIFREPAVAGCRELQLDGPIAGYEPYNEVISEEEPNNGKIYYQCL